MAQQPENHAPTPRQHIQGPACASAELSQHKTPLLHCVFRIPVQRPVPSPARLATCVPQEAGPRHRPAARAFQGPPGMLPRVSQAGCLRTERSEAFCRT